jgi:hypothetical protein
MDYDGMDAEYHLLQRMRADGASFGFNGPRSMLVPDSTDYHFVPPHNPGRTASCTGTA